MLDKIYQSYEVIRQLDLSKAPKGEITNYWLHLVSNGIGQPVYAPVSVARSKNDGPVVGVTAVVHGNELNGLSVVQRLFNQIDMSKLSGTVVGVPVVNVPSIHLHQRRYIDGADLNRIMPGKEGGNRSQVYANRVIERIIKHFDYLLDLHTASGGRVNSYYIRADLNSTVTKKLAELQNPQIILNVPPKDGTMRGAAEDIGIDAITIEVGNPDVFQKGIIRSSLTGMFNTLSHLGMYEEDIDEPDKDPIYCSKSEWIYTDRGGILDVKVPLCARIEKGDLIAQVRDVFGQLIRDYHSPSDGVVIGKSVQPVSETGSRIIHLGTVKE